MKQTREVEHITVAQSAQDGSCSVRLQYDRHDKSAPICCHTVSDVCMNALRRHRSARL